MNKLIAGAALGALLLGAVPTHAQAVATTVEGDAHWDTAGVPNTNDVKVVWGCTAVATPPVDETSVSCTISMGGVSRTVTNSTPGAAAAAFETFRAQQSLITVCWAATAKVAGVVVATDTGCKS